MKLRILVIALIFQLINGFSQETINYSLSDFDVCEVLTGKRMDVDKLLNPGNMKLLDSILIIRNYKTSFFFQVINLNDGITINEFGKNGRGPGELISPFGFQVDNENRQVIVNDPIQKKLMYYSLNKILTNDTPMFNKSVSIDNVPYIRCLIKNNKALCMLMGNPDNHSHCLYDLESSKVTNYFGFFPELGTKYDPNRAGDYFQKPSGAFGGNDKYYVEGYYDLNRIDVYKDNNLELVIVGKENGKLKFRKNKNGPILTDENYFCFESICCSNDLIFAGYCGTSQLTNMNPLIASVLVFDFKGNCLSKFNLDPPVNNFDVDFENKTIWGINKVLEPTLYKFQY